MSNIAHSSASHAHNGEAGSLGMGAGDIKGNNNSNSGLESSRCRENHKHTMNCSGQDNEDHGVYGAPMGRPLGEDQIGSAAHTTTTTTTNAPPVYAPHHSSHDHHSHDSSHSHDALHSHDHSEHTGGSGAHTFGRSGAGEAHPMHSAAGTQPHVHKEGVFDRFDMTKDQTSTAEVTKGGLGKHDVAREDGINRPDVNDDELARKNLDRTHETSNFHGQGTHDDVAPTGEHKGFVQKIKEKLA